MQRFREWLFRWLIGDRLVEIACRLALLEDGQKAIGAQVFEVLSRGQAAAPVKVEAKPRVMKSFGEFQRAMGRDEDYQ